MNPQGPIWELEVVREALLGWDSRHSFLDVSDGLSVKHTQLVAKESPGCQLREREDFDLGCQDSCRGVLILQTDYQKGPGGGERDESEREERPGGTVPRQGLVLST